MGPVKFQVVPANVYDSLVSGTDLLDANASQLGGTTQTGRDIGASVLLSSGTGTGQLDFTSGVVKGNVTQVNGVAQTATLDSLSSQISGIGSGTGAALNFAVAEDNASAPLNGVTKIGTQGATTYANTLANDTSYHTLTSAADGGSQKILWVYGFNVGSGRTGTKIVVRASMSASGDTVTFKAYNFLTTTWDTRTTITGTSSQLLDIPLLAGHTGTGANAGKVYLEIVFDEADAGEINLNEVYCQAQNQGAETYSDGAIWVGGSNANTTVGVDGVPSNPVTWAAAQTLSTSTGLTRFRIRNGTTVTLNASTTSKSLIGKNWTLALGGQAIDGSYFEGAEVSGTGTCTTQAEFNECHLNAGTTTGPAKFVLCGFAGSSGSPFTAGSAGEFLIVDCFSEVAGSGTPYFTFGGASGVNIRRWSGGSNITLNNASATLTMEVVTGGGQTIATAGASIELRGICRAVTLTGIASGATCQIDAVTGPISLAGSSGTVNIYGVCGVVTDARTDNPTLSNKAVSRDTVNAEVDTALADYDAPTNAEMEARTLAAANYATAANQTTIIGYVDCLPATWVVPLDAAGTRTALGLASANLDTQLADLPTAAEIKTAMEAAGSHLALILDDTGTSGVVIAATGLDLIPTTAPSGVATTFRQMVVQLWRRFFKKATMTSTQLKTYADDGTTVVTTQTVSDDGTTQTQGAAS
jgi:hypothetical protein